jgi:hypothetical protein
MSPDEEEKISENDGPTDKAEHTLEVQNLLIASSSNDKSIAKSGSHAMQVGGSFDFESYANEFSSNIYAGELKVSRVAIMQPGSPEIGNSAPGYKTGMMVDTVTREIISREVKSPWLEGKVQPNELFVCHACLVVPCAKLPSEFIKWKNRKTEGTGWHFKTLDRNDPRVKAGLWPAGGGTWGTKPDQVGSPPVTENCNYMCMVLEPSGSKVIDSGIIFTFAKTSFNAGRELTTFIRKGFQHRVPAFGISYWIYTLKGLDEKSNSVFYYMKCAGNAYVTDKEILSNAIDWHKKFSDPSTGRQLQTAYLSISDDQLDSQSSESGGGADNGDPVVDEAPAGKTGNDPF